MKFVSVFFNFAYAMLFYPVMIGLFAWLYVTKANWIWGALIIIAILLLDPIWRTMARTALEKIKQQR